MHQLKTWEELAKWAGVSLQDLVGDSLEAELLRNEPLYRCFMLDDLVSELPELVPMLPAHLQPKINLQTI